MIAAEELLPSYQKATAMLAAGDLRQSADLCREILESYPGFSYGYHLMAELFRATGTYSNAKIFSQKAVEMSPDIASFHFQHAQNCLMTGDWKSACDAFKTVSKLEPQNYLALLCLSDIYTQQGQYDKADRLFAKARTIADVPAVDEHEGLSRIMRGDTATAEKLFDRLILRAPDYECGYLRKGILLMGKEMHHEAMAYFAKAIACNPKSHEALHYAGIIQELLGQNDAAISYARQAIEVSPQAWRSHVLLGQLLTKSRQHHLAEQSFRRAYELHRSGVAVLQLLVNSMFMQGKSQDVLQYVEKVLKMQPDNQDMLHFRAMLRGENTDIAPRTYVADLFDYCADSFEQQLQGLLGYATPKKLAEAVMSLPKVEARQDMSLLDLGCGTGLGAEALRECTRLRVGVDLSPKMLEQARGKQLYNELHALDIVEYMESHPRAFDLVIATDVLVYIGKLESFFKAVRGVLAPRGLLAFSVERETGASDYRLNITGRYSHSSDYVMRLADAEGYVLAHRSETVIRMERNEPVHGIIFIFKKAVSH